MQEHLQALPAVVSPAGLDADRKSYPYSHIRQFCDADKMDLVCPKPAIM